MSEYESPMDADDFRPTRYNMRGTERLARKLVLGRLAHLVAITVIYFQTAASQVGQSPQHQFSRQSLGATHVIGRGMKVFDIHW